MEAIVRYYPEHVNLKKDDGYTSLHVAALNDHSDYVALLASHVCEFRTGFFRVACFETSDVHVCEFPIQIRCHVTRVCEFWSLVL